MTLHQVAYTIYIIWLLSEVLLNRLMRSGAADKQNEDKNSIRVIWLTIILSMTAGSYVSALTECPMGEGKIIEPIGLGIIVLGVILRFAAIRSLGKMFTVDVTIRQDHALHTSGMYKYVRHPSYAASLLSFIGMGISQNNWLSMPIMIFPVLFSFIYRMNVEEKALIQAFGDEYKAYMKRSWRFLRWVY